MGYFQTGTGWVTIKTDNLPKAYQAMCALNDHDHLKKGGSWPGANEPRPAGASHHPKRWFSWMNANYPSKCQTVVDILEELGFDVVEVLNEDGKILYDLAYDNKMGQENLFFQVIAPFVEELMVEWKGEDGGLWMWSVEDGELKVKEGKVLYR